MKKIRVMVIAPYEGLKEAVTTIAPAYQDKLEITTALGDLTSGTILAKQAVSQGYDVIISRGGTAEMIAANVSLPVINIDVSGYDYMRALKLAENIHGKKAIVGFSYITERARNVNELLQANVDIFTIRDQAEIAPLLHRLTANGYELVIGDVATCREAKDMDINHLLLISGEESIADAFESVLTWTHAYSSSLEQLSLLEQIVRRDRVQIAVLEADRIRYATASLSQYGLGAAELAEFARSVPTTGEREFLLSQPDGLLFITARPLQTDFTGAYVFYLHKVPTESQSPMEGVTIRNFKIAPNGDFMRQNGIYDANTIQVAKSFCVSNRPVLLTGGDGVGKVELAASIHKYSERWSRPFVQINCALVNPLQTLQTLLQELGGATVCLEALHMTPPALQPQLAALLTRLDGAHWRLMATATGDIAQKALDGAFDEQLLRFFSQLCLAVPSLNGSREDLQKIISLYIIEANAKLGRQVIGIDDTALDLLVAHQWRYNYEELQQTVYQMVLMTESVYITEAEVNTTLAARALLEEPQPLPLSGTLEQIELQIIRRVLAEEHNNASRTAERLGISRSTLWRKLRDGGEPQ